MTLNRAPGVVLRGVTFTRCSAGPISIIGAAPANLPRDSPPPPEPPPDAVKLLDLDFVNNTGPGPGGRTGAVLASAVDVANASVLIQNCSFVSNVGEVGAVWLENVTAVMRDLEFRDNLARWVDLAMCSGLIELGSLMSTPNELSAAQPQSTCASCCDIHVSVLCL